MNVLALTADGVGTVIFVPGDTRAPNQAGAQTLVTAYRAGGVDALKPALESIMRRRHRRDRRSPTPPRGRSSSARSARSPSPTPTTSCSAARPPSPRARSTSRRPRSAPTCAPGTGPRTTPTGCCARRPSGGRGWRKVGTANSASAVPGRDRLGHRPVRAHPGHRPGRLPGAAGEGRAAARRVRRRSTCRSTDEVKRHHGQGHPVPDGAPEGSRPTIRVLDGTGQLDHGVGAAQILAAAGAQIDAIGNAATFKIPTTQFIISGYRAPGRRPSSCGPRSASARWSRAPTRPTRSTSPSYSGPTRWASTPAPGHLVHRQRRMSAPRRCRPPASPAIAPVSTRPRRGHRPPHDP